MVKEEEEEIVVDIKLEEEKNDPPKVSRPGALKLISLFNSFPANASGNLLPPSFYGLLHVGPLHASDDFLHTLTL